MACKNNHIDIVHFLATAPELKAIGHTLVDIHALSEQGFQEACDQGHQDLIRWWIFELRRHPDWKEEQEKPVVINQEIKRIALDYPWVTAMLRAKEESDYLKENVKK